MSHAALHLEGTLDKYNGSVLDALRSIALPPSGHCWPYLAPAYTSIIREKKKVIKNIKQWTGEILQECFDSTNWNDLLATSTDMNEQVDTVSSYINFCLDMNIIPSNNKPGSKKELGKKRRFSSLVQSCKRRMS